MSRMKGKKTHTHTHTLSGMTHHPHGACCFLRALDNKLVHMLCVCVCVLRHPIHSRRQTCGRTGRGHAEGRSHTISPPSFCGTCLDFSCEKDSAVPFPRVVDREVEFCVPCPRINLTCCEEKSQFMYVIKAFFSSLVHNLETFTSSSAYYCIELFITCMITPMSRVWINRVRLPILRVVS